MRRVAYVITGLGVGGAEEMLFKLLTAERTNGRASLVVSLTDVGPVGARLRALGIPVFALGMRSGRPSPAGLWKLLGVLRQERPDVVQTWMYHADLLGGAAARLLGIPVVWGVRHDRSRKDKPLTRATRRACALVSAWVPEAVVFNSETSRRSHALIGYDEHKLKVIPNGFDVARFRPDPEARAAVRREIGVPEDASAVALVARYHPDKDHATFIAAAGMVLERRPDVHFVLCGPGVDPGNEELARLLRRAGVRAGVHLLGKRSDVERVLAAVDLACLSSRTESFPNAIGEAMACGVPCIATDCGDVRRILGDVGKVVPVADPAALARAVLEHLALDGAVRKSMGKAARLRIVDRFALDAVVRQFQQVHDEAIRSCAG